MSPLSRLHETLLWLAFAVAFFVSIEDAVGLVRTDPRALVMLFAAFWLGLGTFGAEPVGRDRRGLVLLGVAMLLQWMGLLGGTAVLQRVALALGILALGLWVGRPRPRTALVLLLAVPIPSAVLVLTTPDLERFQLELVTALIRPWLGPAQVAGPVAHWVGGSLELQSTQSGLTLLQLLIVFGAHLAVRWSLDVQGTIRVVASTGAAILVLQPIVVASAIGITHFASAVAARSWIEVYVPCLIAIFGTAATEAIRRRPRAAVTR